MNKYKVLLFDLDGTLCETDEMIIQTMYVLYMHFKPAKIRTREELYYFSGPPIRDTLMHEFPDQNPEFMYDVFKSVSKGFYPIYVKPYQDEIEILTKLKEKGYLLGVVTNKGLPLTKYSLEICHINHLFDVIISSDDVINPKPDPFGIFKALHQLGIKKKEEALYIGDNDIDYITAENAGVDTLLVSWGPREIKCINKAKYVAQSYNEIGGILL